MLVVSEPPYVDETVVLLFVPVPFEFNGSQIDLIAVIAG